MKKFVYLFNEGNSDMKELLGGKGANLAEMTNIGLPVPFGFTISTQACNDYYEAGKKISENVEKQISDALHTLEQNTGKKLGDPTNPLISFSTFRICIFNAWNDGYRLKSWYE